jgi:hypothetical protein
MHAVQRPEKSPHEAGQRVTSNSRIRGGGNLPGVFQSGAYLASKITLRISVNVTAHFANNVTGGFTRLRGV